MTKLDFDANDYEPMGSFEPIPVGEYTVVISASEEKLTKDGNGKYLQLVYDVIDDNEYHGRKIFDRLNLVNNNETAVKIARSALSAICRAVGVMAPSDSTELHDKPFIVKVGIRKGNDEYPDSNVVKAYKSLNPPEETPEEKPKETTKTTPAKTEQKKPAAGKKPWDKD